MSDRWLNNIYKKFKNTNIDIQPVLNEIKRRHKKRSKNI